MDYSDRPYPSDILSRDTWFVWKETNERKIPRAPWNNPEWHDKYESAQDPDVWTDADTALTWADRLPGFEPAINIRDRDEYPEENLVFFDFDDVRDPDTGDIHPVALEIVADADTYAQVSTSGTGIHALGYGEFPDHVKSVKADLPTELGFPDAEIEVYESARFVAMTGDKMDDFSDEVCECQAVIDDVCERFVTTPASRPDELEREPDLSREELADIETTDDMSDVFDAIKHTGPRDIRLRSTVSGERGDGTKSMNPSWAQSKSGTRLAEVDGGWVYRKGMVGLDALQVVALEERIISDETKYPSGGDFWDAVDALRERGAHIPEYDPSDDDTPDRDDDKWDYYVHALEDRRNYDSIDNVSELPEKSFVLDKPPREGGSYRIMGDFTDDGSNFIVLAPRHKILEYHMETLADLTDSDWTITHFKGKTRVCDSDSQCAAAPTDYEEIQQWEQEVRNITHNKQTITADDCPAGLCKYWFLKTAAEYSDVVLTVPQLARRFDPKDGAKLFVDEEQSLQHFRPGSVELCSVTQVRETDGTANVQLGAAPLLKQLETLADIRETIEDEIKERKESDGGFREVPYQEAILDAIDAIHDIADALGLSDAQADVRARGEQVSLGTTIDELQTRLEAVSFPEVDSDTDQLKDKIDEYCAPYFYDESADPAAFLEAVLFPYEDKRFHIKQVGNERTIRLVGDGEHVFFQDWLGDFEQLALIAGPEGERFLSEVKGQDSCVLRINSFKHADDFVVFPVGKKDNDDNIEALAEQRTRAAQIVRKANHDQHPILAVTGTKDQARALHSDCQNTADIVTDPTSPAQTLYKLWTVGATGIIYENSVVSRGIDAPHFDVTVIASPGFSVPYWEARAERWHNEDTDEYMEALAVEQELKDRELTNAALRMSPTYDTEPMTGTKLIFAAADDVERLKFLSDREAPRVAYASTAVGIMELLTVGGSFESTLSDVYDGMGNSEKDMITTAFIEDFSENGVERPEYDFQEIQMWVENRYLTGNAVQAVINAVDTAGQAGEHPTTTQIHESLPGLNDSRISAILKVLRRRGDVRAETDAADGAGRPATRWVREVA
jgi:hypothetical protein